MEIKVLRKNGWEAFHIPLQEGRVEDGIEAVHVEGRLSTTRTGLNSGWKVSFDLPTLSTRRPRVNLEFRGNPGIAFLGWHSPATIEGVPNRDGAKAISWGGSLWPNPATVWGDEVIDLSYRKEREAIILAAISLLEDVGGGSIFQQGGMTISKIQFPLSQIIERAGIDMGTFEKVSPRREAPVTLFNHSALCQTRVGFDNYRLLVVGDEDRTTITSPDHPFEPVALHEGNWLLCHPIPRRGKVVD